MVDRLERISIRGYKSFEALDIELRPINVLIGANGAGKSNLLSLFRMLKSLADESLQLFVARAGGADMILHYGRKKTPELRISLWFRMTRPNLYNGYECSLVPVGDTLYISYEKALIHSKDEYPQPAVRFHKGPYKESALARARAKAEGAKKQVVDYVWSALQSYRLYHFHDTSEGARIKQPVDINQRYFLWEDAGNLAAYLFFLREAYPAEYRSIIEAIRLAAPYFGEFVLEPHPLQKRSIHLAWQERGSEVVFGPNALSDGTLRFIALTVLFLQPSKFLPKIILMDEPELGLHPYAIALLAEMIHSVSRHTQLIIATQSPTLLNHFEPADILVVDREKAVSTVRRLNEKDLVHWLEDYSIGQLWEKNILKGGPSL
ncbi:MAG: AAA family ATPase [Bacteroidia bacterium]|jgi:predicted ATPase|nr:AAA family ATPase [Bacteroidia bacterium]GIV24080.1 MAG: chromosome segregation protein SMC [Bacteroidia bacterium]